jgi:hypothetical protein
VLSFIPDLTNFSWVRSTALPQCVTCLTWVSRHEGSHLIQPRPSRDQRHNASPNNPGLSPIPSIAASSSSKTEAKAVAEASSSDATGGWADVIWQKWRWGLFIAIAVIVSRLSSS